ncbi:3-keto-disaccharide hydrolase [Mariniphaga sediminis]|uniref:3-keto-disaccharide hydrolase n=1 Tax=Mariniphaga sediminis TaxID=1628158 RepID=UPI003563788B
MRIIPFCKMLIIVVIMMVTACNSGKKSQQEQTKSAQASVEENWIPLFNGKNLEGWQIKFTGYELGYNLNNTFRVEDGLLRVRYDDWDDWGGQFGHIFYDGEFSHYRLRVEYRFVDKQIKGGPGWAYRNNGLMLHGQSAESMEIDQDFPVSIEVQLLGGNGKNERSTMNLCTPGTNVEMDGILIEQHCTNSGSETFHGDQWVSVEVEVKGGEVIRHFIEGKEVMSYEKPQFDPREQYYEKLLPADGNKIISQGTISLQAESHPTDFRKIELLILEE